MDVNVETPSVDIDIDKPSGGFDINMPDISLPKFGFKGKKPNADLNVELPEAKLTGPDFDVKVDAILSTSSGPGTKFMLSSLLNM